ncbi:MAG: ABC-2 family transporter protein [Armatimonadetes bacterium]|nr:ABC-2 family transporter protein [Armatimonadota bacterium]
MSIALRKTRALLSAYLQDTLAYRASMVIWILTDVTNTFIMPLVWLASLGDRTEIGGFTGSGFVMYYLVLAITSNFAVSHLMWDISFEIKEGVISQWLVRPIPYLYAMFVRNFTWRLIRGVMLVPLVGMFALYHWHRLDATVLTNAGPFFLSLFLGHIVSFWIAMSLSSLAFWFHEVYSVYGLYYVPAYMLSGWVAPIELMQPWMQALAAALPFRYVTAVPVEIAVGRITGDAIWYSILGQIVWLVLAVFLALFLWRKGLKEYSGIGM